MSDAQSEEEMYSPTEEQESADQQEEEDSGDQYDLYNQGSAEDVTSSEHYNQQQQQNEDSADVDDTDDKENAEPLDVLIPTVESAEEHTSQASSTRAVRDGMRHARPDEPYSRTSKDPLTDLDDLPPAAPPGTGVDPLMLSQGSAVGGDHTGAEAGNDSEETGVPPPPVTLHRMPRAAKPAGGAVTRQQSRASLMASQGSRLTGASVGAGAGAGTLQRADGTMGSIDLNRSVIESTISPDVLRKKSGHGAERRRDGRWPSPKRPRVPPRFVKVSKVSLSASRTAASSAPPGMSYNDITHPATSALTSKSRAPSVSKVIGWDEATNARPPLRIDMDGPTPWTYSPRNKPLYETNSPAHSFGRRTFVEKDGGSRTAWTKTWFQTGGQHVWTQKADFHSDQQWPTPNKYKQKTTLGTKQDTKLAFPSYSCGIKRNSVISKKGSAFEPSPCEYNPERATSLQMRTPPAYTHGHRRGGTVIWLSTGSEKIPGPGSYNPSKRPVKPHHPTYTIRGTRKLYEHEYGPFAAF